MLSSFWKRKDGSFFDGIMDLFPFIGSFQNAGILKRIKCRDPLADALEAAESHEVAAKPSVEGFVNGAE